MVAVPEHGSLEETPLPRLLIDLFSAGFSGRVELRRERVKKHFLFDSGIPIYAESNLASESLGVQLMDAGAITRGDYNRVVAQVERDGCKEGVALLDLDLIEPRGLFVALKDQVRTRIIECFGWTRGEFTIDPSIHPPADAQPFRADLYSLLQEGIEVHWSIDRVLADLEPNMARYPKRSGKLSRIQPRLLWDDQVGAFIDALDGTETLWSALRLASSARAMAAAWVIDAAHAVDYRDTGRGHNAAEPPLEVELVLSEPVAKADAGHSAAKQPEKVAAARIDPDHLISLRLEIVEKFERLDALDYYELLGVAPAAETDELKTAYLLAAKTYHPDALARAHLDPATREQASKIFGAIGRAYGVLSNEDRRQEYDTAQASEGGGIDADRLANAETLYRKGDVLLRLGNFRGAVEYLAPAVELWPREVEYRSALGWALYKKMPSDPKGAKHHLECAAELAGDDAVVIFRLSVVLRALGETVAGATLLDRARQLDPKVS